MGRFECNNCGSVKVDIRNPEVDKFVVSCKCGHNDTYTKSEIKEIVKKIVLGGNK
ncbi:MAG: hypothetical protein ACRCX2_14935 [Paraclostridium sp.]